MEAQTAVVVNNIDDYCRGHGLTRATFEKKCEISNGLVMNWAKGNYVIGLRTLEKIAKHTNTPIDKWLRKGSFNDDRPAAKNQS